MEAFEARCEEHVKLVCTTGFGMSGGEDRASPFMANMTLGWRSERRTLEGPRYSWPTCQSWGSARRTEVFPFMANRVRHSGEGLLQWDSETERLIRKAYASADAGMMDST